MLVQDVKKSKNVKTGTVPISGRILSDQLAYIIVNAIGELTGDEFYKVAKCAVNFDPEKGGLTIAIQR